MLVAVVAGHFCSVHLGSPYLAQLAKRQLQGYTLRKHRRVAQGLGLFENSVLCGMKRWEGLENYDLTNKNGDSMGFIAELA